MLLNETPSLYLNTYMEGLAKVGDTVSKEYNNEPCASLIQKWSQMGVAAIDRLWSRLLGSYIYAADTCVI